MSHALVIAAIFVPYVALMVGLGIYIARSGHHEDRQDQHPDTPRRDDAEMATA